MVYDIKRGGDLGYSCMMSECNYWMCFCGCAQGGSSEKGVPYRAKCSSAVEIGGFLLQMDVQGFKSLCEAQELLLNVFLAAIRQRSCNFVIDPNTTVHFYIC